MGRLGITSEKSFLKSVDYSEIGNHFGKVVPKIGVLWGDWESLRKSHSQNRCIMGRLGITSEKSFLKSVENGEIGNHFGKVIPKVGGEWGDWESLRESHSQSQTERGVWESLLESRSQSRRILGRLGNTSRKSFPKSDGKGEIGKHFGKVIPKVGRLRGVWESLQESHSQGRPMSESFGIASGERLGYPGLITVSEGQKTAITIDGGFFIRFTYRLAEPSLA
jgi:hypothetical protein